MVQVPPGPKPSVGSEAPLPHPYFPRLLHFSSERGASGQTLCPALSASVQGRSERSPLERSGRREPTGDPGATLTCRFRTLSETFSWDMLRSRCRSFANSSGIKTLSCERARDPMGFNCLQKKGSNAAVIHSVFFFVTAASKSFCMSNKTNEEWRVKQLTLHL